MEATENIKRINLNNRISVIKNTYRNTKHYKIDHKNKPITQKQLHKYIIRNTHNNDNKRQMVDSSVRAK